MRANASRLLALRVATKLLALIALAALLLLFISALIPSREAADAQSAIKIDHLQQDHLLRAQWNGHRILVLRRSPTALAQLNGLDMALTDPGSFHSEQPKGYDLHFRSATADYFVALDYDPDFGCPLEYLPATEKAPVTPWAGGFHSPCSDSWFDPAGRVYRNQRTTHNLRVPPHQVGSETILLGE